MHGDLLSAFTWLSVHCSGRAGLSQAGQCCLLSLNSDPRMQSGEEGKREREKGGCGGREEREKLALVLKANVCAGHQTKNCSQWNVSLQYQRRKLGVFPRIFSCGLLGH